MSYITGQLDRDTHKDLDTDAKVAAIHDDTSRDTMGAEQFFRYVQIFTAIVDSFSHGASSDAMGPFAAAYVAYKKGKVVKQAEMDPGTMLWILALGGRVLLLLDWRDVLQDHERHGRKLTITPSERVVYRARRGARGHLWDGPGPGPRSARRSPSGCSRCQGVNGRDRHPSGCSRAARAWPCGNVLAGLRRPDGRAVHARRRGRPWR